MTSGIDVVFVLVVLFVLFMLCSICSGIWRIQAARVKFRYTKRSHKAFAFVSIVACENRLGVRFLVGAMHPKRHKKGRPGRWHEPMANVYVLTNRRDEDVHLST